MNTPEKKEVGLDRYAEVAVPHLKEKVILPLESWEIGLLHGMIRIFLSLPAKGNLSDTSLLAIRRWRDFCLTVIGSWGFTPEEVAWLDSADVLDAGQPAAGGSGTKGVAIIFEPGDEPAIDEFAAHAKYPIGISMIDQGKCPRGMKYAAACMFCANGHMLECHYPKTCEEAECGHYIHGRN